MNKLQMQNNESTPVCNDKPEQNDTSAAGAQRKRIIIPKIEMIAVADIQLLDDFRFRVEDDKSTIERYAETFQQYLDDVAAGVEDAKYPFPSIHVLRENDANIVVAGRHRFQAASLAGVPEVRCIVLTSREKAIQAGLESNRHGLPLKDGDKARCIRLAILAMPELSNRSIAELIGCNSRYVDRIVNEGQLRTGTHPVKGRDGKMYSVPKSNPKPVQPQEESADESEAPEPLMPELDTEPEAKGMEPEDITELGGIECADDAESESESEDSEYEDDTESEDSEEPETEEGAEPEDCTESDSEGAECDEDAEQVDDAPVVFPATNSSPVKAPTTLSRLEDSIIGELTNALAMPVDSTKRSNALMSVFTTIIDDCFTKDTVRQKFIQALQGKYVA